MTPLRDSPVAGRDPDTAVTQRARANLAELRMLIDALDEAQLGKVARRLAAAPRLFFTGAGRSGLAARAMAMRLMHIGKACYVVGDTVTPAVRDGDVLVAFTSSGRASVLDQARTALDLGADVVAISTGENDVTDLSLAFVTLPARTIVQTEQYAGSLFEQGCLVVGDAICAEVQSLLDVPTRHLDGRHANIS